MPAKKYAAKAQEKIQEQTQKVQVETTQAVEVVASTMEEPAKVSETNETIAIAICLPHDVKFDDIPDGKGGVKSITLPGINSNLRGVKNAVLALPGNALCVQLPKKDWESLLAIHGREVAFTGRNGGIPCIYPVGDKAGFKAAQSEIKEMRTGLDPVLPKTVGVEERKARNE